VVLTGGGALLRHVSQLTEFVTHMDTRIGYPNEHLASSETNELIANPIFATGVGLVMWGLEKEAHIEIPEIEEIVVEKPIEEQPATAVKQPKKEGVSIFGTMKSGFGKMKDVLEGFLDEVGDDK